MTRSEDSDSRRLGALTELLRVAVKAPTAVELDRGLNRIRAQVAAGRTRSRISLRLAVLASAVLACVMLAVVLVPRFVAHSSVSPPSVAVTRVEGGTILEGGYLSEVGNEGVALLFSEGSKFVLTPGTRGRLRALTTEGARLALDHGTASFQITPHLEHRWWVEAGPFLVSVRGTDFTVVWEPTSEQFEVKLRQGRVAVSGPVLGEELILRPGQTLRVNLRKGETVITDGRTENVPAQASLQSAPSANASAPVAPLPSAAGTPSAQSPANAGASGERRWREAVANGQWDRILADVERDGVEASLPTLSSDELFALADAARYRRRPDLARSALLAQRERFPNSSRASDAVFLLGRVEESRAAGRAAAVKRYDEYLARASSGTYAAEALGRKMILVKELHGSESARPIAEEYLRRFPSGSYADAARTLARAP